MKPATIFGPLRYMEVYVSAHAQPPQRVIVRSVPALVEKMTAKTLSVVWGTPCYRSKRIGVSDVGVIQNDRYHGHLSISLSCFCLADDEPRLLAEMKGMAKRKFSETLALAQAAVDAVADWPDLPPSPELAALLAEEDGD